MCLVFVLFARGASADPIAITFDDQAAGTYLSSFYQPLGIRFASHNSPVGETFDVNTGRIQILSSPLAPSQPNAAAPSAPIGDFTFTDISGSFLLSDSIPWTVNSLSLDVIATAQPAPWILSLYNTQNLLLESRQGTANALLTFTRPDIASFALFGNGSQMIDNVTFTPTPTPEPATLMIVGAGLAGLGVRLKRRHRDVLRYD